MSAASVGWLLLAWLLVSVVCAFAWSIVRAPSRAGAADLDTSPCPYGFHNTLCGFCGVCACHPDACPDCWCCHTVGCKGACTCQAVAA